MKELRVRHLTRLFGARTGFTQGDPRTMAGVNLGHVQIFLEQGRRIPKPKATLTAATWNQLVVWLRQIERVPIEAPV